MIRIDIPKVARAANGKARLTAGVTDDVYGWQQDLWYEVEAEYGEWLCAETSDSFVLAL